MPTGLSDSNENLSEESFVLGKAVDGGAGSRLFRECYFGLNRVEIKNAAG